MNRKGFAPILIIGIIALIVIAGVAAWYFVAHKNPAPPTGVACTTEAKECPDGSYVGRTGPDCQFATCPEEPVASSTTTTTTINTSDWQTFTDHQYGLTVQYPADWYLNGSIASGGTVDILDSFPASQAAHGSWVFEGSGEITIYRSSSTLQQAMDSELVGETATGSAITVDSTQGLEASYDIYDPKNVDQKFIDVFIPYNGFIYEISLDDYDYPQSIDIFNAFLNSIQFMQTALNVAGWKTYMDPQFTISIPANWIGSSSTTIQGQSNDPLRTISFYDPDVDYSVLYVMTYPHGFSDFSNYDEVPAYLGGDQQTDFYFVWPNGNINSSLMAELKASIATFKMK